MQNEIIFGLLGYEFPDCHVSQTTELNGTTVNNYLVGIYTMLQHKWSLCGLPDRQQK
jgi:hypothetical protein